MKRITKLVTVMGLLVFSAYPSLRAQVLDFLPFKIAPGVSLLPSPSVSFSPETNWSFGAAFITTFKANDADEKYLSKTHLDIIYTLKKQFIFDIDYDVFLARGQWFIRGSSSFYDYPEYYHSMLGASGESDGKELIESKRLELNNTLMYRLHKDWYVGLLHLFQRITDLNYDPQGAFAFEQNNPHQNTLHQGLGLGFTADQRSYPLNPVPGDSYFNFTTMAFPTFMGTPLGFTRTEIDYRYYLPGFRHDQILALQTFGIHTTGAPPYRLTGLLGGSRQMRGYYYGRYRDRQYFSIQAEYRARVYKWLGLVGFAGIGNVAHDLTDLFNEAPKPSYGIGIRILLDPENRANLRIDYARGLNSDGWYISYGESF